MLLFSFSYFLLNYVIGSFLPHMKNSASDINKIKEDYESIMNDQHHVGEIMPDGAIKEVHSAFSSITNPRINDYCAEITLNNKPNDEQYRTLKRRIAEYLHIFKFVLLHFIDNEKAYSFENAEGALSSIHQVAYSNILDRREKLGDDQFTSDEVIREIKKHYKDYVLEDLNEAVRNTFNLNDMDDLIDYMEVNVLWGALIDKDGKIEIVNGAKQSQSNNEKIYFRDRGNKKEGTSGNFIDVSNVNNITNDQYSTLRYVIEKALHDLDYCSVKFSNKKINIYEISEGAYQEDTHVPIFSLYKIISSDYDIDKIINDIKAEKNGDFYLESIDESNNEDIGVIKKSGKVVYINEDDDMLTEYDPETDIYFDNHHPLIVIPIDINISDNQSASLSRIIEKQLRDKDYCKVLFDYPADKIVVFENYKGALNDDTGEDYPYDIRLKSAKSGDTSWYPNEVIYHIKEELRDDILEDIKEKVTIKPNNHGFDVFFQSGLIKEYKYGINASWNKRDADASIKDHINSIKYGWDSKYSIKPYVGDILDGLSLKYDLNFIDGENLFNGKKITAKEFIDKYVDKDSVLESMNNKKSAAELAKEIYQYYPEYKKNYMIYSDGIDYINDCSGKYETLSIKEYLELFLSTLLEKESKESKIEFIQHLFNGINVTGAERLIYDIDYMLNNPINYDMIDKSYILSYSPSSTVLYDLVKSNEKDDFIEALNGLNRHAEGLTDTGWEEINPEYEASPWEYYDAMAVTYDDDYLVSIFNPDLNDIQKQALWADLCINMQREKAITVNILEKNASGLLHVGNSITKEAVPFKEAEKVAHEIIEDILGKDEILEEIVKKGNKWQVQSEKGKNLGTYDTKEEAEKRLQQVHYFKHMNESPQITDDQLEDLPFDVDVFKDEVDIEYPTLDNIDDYYNNKHGVSGHLYFGTDDDFWLVKSLPLSSLKDLIQSYETADSDSKKSLSRVIFIPGKARGETIILRDSEKDEILESNDYPSPDAKDTDISGEELDRLLKDAVKNLSPREGVNFLRKIFPNVCDEKDRYGEIILNDDSSLYCLYRYLKTGWKHTDDHPYSGRITDWHKDYNRKAINLKALYNIDKDDVIEAYHKRTIEDVKKEDIIHIFDDKDLHRYYNKDDGCLYYKIGKGKNEKYHLLANFVWEKEYAPLEKTLAAVLKERKDNISIIYIEGLPIFKQFKLDDMEDTYLENISESLLLEKTRQQLIDKSKKSDKYKAKDRAGENRWTRRTRSHFANTVRDYNKIDMDAFFKADILDFVINIKGETNDYQVVITFEHALRNIQDEIKRNKGKLEFRCILRALIDAFNRGDVYVSCSCLHPDTKIKLLDGSTPTVAEMKKRFDAGEQLYVYSVDEKGDFKPGVVEKVWITKKESNLIKITLDNGEQITTTLDHPYMLRNSNYRLAQNLSVGDSLMPMYFNTANGYETVKLNSEERGWHSIYKLVADYFKSQEIEEAKLRVNPDDNMSYDVAIHHKDFNKKNNNPDNLQIMTAKEHWSYHNSLTWENKPNEMKEHIRQKSRENAIKRNANPTERMLECRKIFIEKGHKNAEFRNHDHECLKKQAELMRKTMKQYYKNISEEDKRHLSEIRRKNTLNAHAKGCYKTEAFKKAALKRKETMHTPEREALSKQGVIRYYSDPSNKDMYRIKTLDTKIKTILYKMLDNNLDLTEDNYELVRKQMNGYPKITKRFNNIDEAVSYFNLNHKIIDIEYITLDEPIDVYDIKVKDWENFVVDAGVVLHNCPDFTYRQAYWATKGGYNSGTPQPSNGKMIANPDDTKGGGCKHINLVLGNLDWMMKIASVINNYIYWARDNLEWQYSKYIFPELYGMSYDKAIQMTIDMYNEEGELKPEYQDDRLLSDENIINMSNMIGKQRGQYKKKPEKSINPRYSDLHPKEEEPIEEPEEEEQIELNFDNENNEPELDIEAQEEETI